MIASGASTSSRTTTMELAPCGTKLTLATVWRAKTQVQRLRALRPSLRLQVAYVRCRFQHCLLPCHSSEQWKHSSPSCAGGVVASATHPRIPA